MPIFLKSGSLNLLEPSGPVQAFTGIALPLPSPTENGYQSGVKFKSPERYKARFPSKLNEKTQKCFW
jgi:hypothetical protein